MTNETSTQAHIFPSLRYEDAPAAIDWLERAFGFERRLVVPGEGGAIVHAELSLGAGNGVIMLGTAAQDWMGTTTPRRAGGVTASLYIYVEDPASHYARAKAAGAQILRELEDTHYGSREYSARDPEGQVWHFGNYLPEATPGTD